jgi:hypothetical protein
VTREHPPDTGDPGGPERADWEREAVGPGEPAEWEREAVRADEAPGSEEAGAEEAGAEEAGPEEAGPPEAGPAPAERRPGPRDARPPVEATGAGDERPRPRLDPGRFRRNLSWGLFTVAVVLALVFALLWRGAVSDRDRLAGAETEKADVTRTATAFLEALTNFKGATIDDDVARIRSFAVGDFAGQLETFFDADAREALRKAQAESTGDVQAVFIQSLSGEDASVFGTVQETLVNTSTTTPRTQLVLVDIQMIHTDAGWKVSKVDILQSPGATGLPGA